jgi:hypothetical protein
MTLPPIFATFRCYKNATFSTDEIIIKDDDGQPLNLDGWTGVFRTWREDDDPDTDDPVFELSTENGKLVVTTAEGKVVGTLPADEADITVDPDGEQWFATLVMTNTTPDPDYVERTVQGFVVAFP